MRLITVVGARPQFIKAAVLSRALRENPEFGISEKIVHTGQHFDPSMSEIFFQELQIPAPAINLNIAGGSHGKATGQMLQHIEEVLLEERPDMLLVYGDTNSTLAGALAAAKLHIPVSHVEAGLRSFNRRMPEELNRVMTDHISDLLFCTSQLAIDNLSGEGISNGVHMVGDTMYDSALFYGSKAELSPYEEDFALATVHRAENTDDPARLAGIFDGFARSPLPIVLPLHPRTAGALKKNNIVPPSTVRLVEPMGYIDMINHLKNCQFVLTDSGGLQKEAYFFSKRCLTLRDETEWVELVDVGANRLVGADPQVISVACDWAMQSMSDNPSLYGDGQSGLAIAKILVERVKSD